MTVLVCGVNGQQAQRIKDSVSQPVLIAGSQESPRAWQRRAGGASVAVVWAKFCSHNHVEALQSQGVPVHYARGGIPSVIDAINQLLTNSGDCNA